MKPFETLTKEQTRRESTVLSYFMGETAEDDLIRFEDDLSEKRDRTLFKLIGEIEDTENALSQAEQLVQRLKKHLEQLKDMQRVLSK